jgi:raffinose/stachyose/melibiose transport system permease protein
MATTISETRLAKEQQRTSRKTRLRLGTLLIHGLLLLAGFFYVYPFLWVLGSSFKSLNGFFTSGLSIVPDIWRWQNYLEAWTKANFGVYFFNTLFITVAVVALTNLFSSMAAFSLARTQLPGKALILTAIGATLFLPRGYTLLPVFEIVLALGLNNTLWAVILVDTAGGLIFFTFLYFGFLTTISREIEEAAIIDGASFFQLYWRIVMPMSLPMVATVTLFKFKDTWNEFLTPLVFTLGKPELRTLAVGMFAFQGENSTDWTLMCAAAVISILPIVLVFIFLQRYFIEGIAGAVK